jgi:hypothetical protein
MVGFQDEACISLWRKCSKCVLEEYPRLRLDTYSSMSLRWSGVNLCGFTLAQGLRVREELEPFSLRMWQDLHMFVAY